MNFLADFLKTVPPHRALIRSIEAKFYQELDLPRPILDIGCGDGTFAQIALKKFHPINTGADPDPSELNSARQSGAYQKLVRAPAEKLPFADQSFGSVISNCTLEHICQLDHALSEIQRVLKPTGWFVCTVVGENFGPWLLGSQTFGSIYERFFHYLSHHHHYDNLNNWSTRFKRHNFRILKTKPYVSPQALKVFDALHYLGAPFLISRKLFRTWVLFPNFTRALFQPLLQRYYSEKTHQGAYYFFLCQKSQPIDISKH